MHFNENTTPIIFYNDDQRIEMSISSALNMLIDNILHLQNRIDALSKFTFMTEQEKAEYKALMDKEPTK